MYRPSQRPSFRFRMFPSPFARLFGIKSAPFDNEQYRNQGNKATEKRNRYQKVIICPSEPRCLIFDYCGAIFALPGAFSLVTAVRFLNGRKFLFIDYSGAKCVRPAPSVMRIRLPCFSSKTAIRHHQNPWDICVCGSQDASRSEIPFKRRHNRLR